MKGSEAVEAHMVFEGRLQADSFRAFARHRAARLALDLAFEEDRGGIACRVRGPLALVDAFEMACSLGPIDCVVLDVRRVDLG
jgi:hypothetical protein